MADSVDSNPTLRSSIAPGLLSGLAFLLLLAVVWSDPLFVRRSFAGRDLIAYNLPMEKAIHDAYARGHFPLWVDEISGGRPLLPNPNAGAMYPVRILLALLPFPLAAKLFPILHWALAGLGALALARRLGLSRAGAWIAGVTYAFSGVVVSDVFFPHVLPGVALLPWVVWVLAGSGSTSPAASPSFAAQAFRLSLLFTLSILAGDPFTFGMALLACAGWIAFAAPRPERIALARLLASAAGLAALAGLPQILATALWIPETHRAVTGVTWREALQFSVSPWRLLELVVPYPFGRLWTNDVHAAWGWTLFSGKMMGLFLTLYAGSLSAIALVVTWPLRTATARFGRFLVGAALVLSASWFLIPAPWREHAAPVALRNPEKFALLLPFGLAILSGAALDVLSARPRLPRWILGVGAGLTAATVAALLLPLAAARLAVAATATENRADLVEIASRQLPLALAEGASLWMATALGLDWARSRERPRAPAAWAGLALLTLVPIAATRRIGWTFLEEEVFAPPPAVRWMRKLDPEGRYRTLGEMAYRQPQALESAESGYDLGYLEIVRRNFDTHAMVLWGRGAVLNADFDNGDLSRVESIRQLSGMDDRFRDLGALFGSLALRFGVRYRDQLPPVAGFAPVRTVGNDAWDENPAALPDIRLATAWREEPDALSALRDLQTLERGAIVVESGRSGSGAAPASGPNGAARTANGPAGTAGVSAPNGGAGTARVLARSPERLLVETDSTAPGWLFVLRGFWRHRVVRVDGVETEVVPAQLAFSAVALPAGRHRVEWQESFPGWPVSRFGPVLYGLAIAGLFERARVVRTREHRAARSNRSSA
ncbi:MAG TPA: hypothetical protein VGK26_08590 [Thermoanaerobaculia bacterium]